MFIAYYDESGDDGFPKYSSEIFLLTTLYMRDKCWKDNYAKTALFRKHLKDTYGFPVKLEFHTKYFLTDKNPYRQFAWSPAERKKIIFELFSFINTLEIRIVNVAIIKGNILRQDYNVLDKAFTYSIQRIENDLKNRSDNNFFIITDEGRIGAMRKTSRKIQHYNPIPSKIFPGTIYRDEIKLLIEDPFAKESDQSYFLQIVDAISYIIYLYSIYNFINKDWGKRVKQVLTYENVLSLLNTIKPRINCNAAPDNEFGIVNYPKK